MGARSWKKQNKSEKFSWEVNILIFDLSKLFSLNLGWVKNKAISYKILERDLFISTNRKDQNKDPNQFPSQLKFTDSLLGSKACLINEKPANTLLGYGQLKFKKLEEFPEGDSHIKYSLRSMEWIEFIQLICLRPVDWKKIAYTISTWSSFVVQKDEALGSSKKVRLVEAYASLAMFSASHR